MKIPTHRLFVVAPLALVAIAAILIAGCGGGDDDTTAATENESEAAVAGGGGGGASLEIKMGDFFFDPENASAQAGPTTIEAPNEGKVEHELVVFKSNLSPAKLPTEANGEVDEEKLEQTGAEEAGEIEDVEPGQSKSGDFKLSTGEYVMFCNLPGHYAQGMYGTLTVSE